ncbi:lipocalin family protein [Nocardia asteroides]|uniref:lipocalin family protein n=1 Tax=Nocardia asteroides TaxID=1824 RepID=UPI001E3252E4|nr:lipocalin family protein [Nocardia asteroides]UGT57061.1 lipocalin family protein [Nocardia asteroides]
MRVRRIPRTTALFVAAAATLLGAGAAQAAPPAPVPRLDLDRYLGEWRQLAAIPQVFNLECAVDTTATYTLDPRGDIGVHNRCRNWAGGTTEIRGTATVNDPVTNAQLHVSFPGVPGQGERAGATNYIVTALGPDYEWALVTSPSRLSGFVLSRTPALDEATWRRIDDEIRAAGQDPCVYLVSPTTGGRAEPRPLCAR